MHRCTDVVFSMLRRLSPDQLDDITDAFQADTRAILRRAYRAADHEAQEKINKVGWITLTFYGWLCVNFVNRLCRC